MYNNENAINNDSHSQLPHDNHSYYPGLLPDTTIYKERTHAIHYDCLRVYAIGLVFIII